MKRKIFLLLTLILMGGALSAEEQLEQATFGGGCFWCMEPPFEKLDGVKTVISGYSGGLEKNPTYEDVSSGKTHHAEVVQVTYDPEKISYKELLDVFWMSINPVQVNGQFADHGPQYRTAIFYHSAAQKKEAEASKEALSKSGKFDEPIATEITAFSGFYPAEEYHQDYYKKNPIRYKLYRVGSGREDYLRKTWGKE